MGLPDESRHQVHIRGLKLSINSEVEALVWLLGMWQMWTVH